MQVRNYSIAPATTANVTSLPRFTVSGDLYDDDGTTLLRSGSFTFPDILKTLTAAQRQELMEMIALRIVQILAGR